MNGKPSTPAFKKPLRIWNRLFGNLQEGFQEALSEIN